MAVETEVETGGAGPAFEAVPLAEWRALFHDSPLAIAYVTPDLRLLRVNGAFAVLCGRMAGELLGRHCYEVLGSPAGDGGARCAACRVAECLSDGALQEFERLFGQEVLREVTSPVTDRWGRAAGAVVTLSRVGAAERDLRRQVVACQRLAAAGTMTSGVAHELKNPLTSILGFAQLLCRRNDLPEGARAQAERIWAEARRCDRIVGSLLKFTRRRDGGKLPVDVNRVVAESLDLLRYQLAVGRVRLHEHYHPEPLEVVGHFCELQQVVQNIVSNAHDALHDAATGGGNLLVRTRGEDGWALMEFENDGPRLAEPHKLFQPFYTTKEAGKGTGLGLSVSHGIVADHGGRIEALNLASGVLFRVALPRAPSRGEPEATADEARGPAPGAARQAHDALAAAWGSTP